MAEEDEETNLFTLAISLFKFTVFGSVTFVLGWYCWAVITGDSQTILQWIAFVIVLPIIFYTTIKTLFAFVLSVIDIILLTLTFFEFIFRKRR